MAPGPALIQFWQTQACRDAFLSHLGKEDLLACRHVCWDFSLQTAPHLFAELEVRFRRSTFTRPSRMAALERIGHHVKRLTLKIPHTAETFLPPIIDPLTGEEQTFVYVPQVHPSLSIPRYGSWEMTDLLVKQYPPLFHAATNIPSFIQAFTMISSMQHLRIACDGQIPSHRYRRSVVDYALISVRVAIEQAPLTQLDSLALRPIHPGATLYLQPSMGFGTSPASRKRWLQIRRLDIEMESFPYGPGQPTDHLKLLNAYLRQFQQVQRVSFRWLGVKGPCPLSLDTELCLVPAVIKPTKSTSRPTPPPTPPSSQACPKTHALPPRALHFPNLQHMHVENATMDASQIATLILTHRHTLLEFNFEEAILRTGTWDEALAPLTRMSGSERWKEKQEEVMDVPIVLSPVGVSRKQLQGVIQAAQAMAKQQKKKTGTMQTQIPTPMQFLSQHRRQMGDQVGSFARARSKTRDLLWATRPDHVKRFFQSPVFSWL